MNVVITMAGLGKRFRDAGYNIPKYEIMAHGRTLFEWSLRSLRPILRESSRLVFVTLAENHAEQFIRGACESLGYSSVSVVELEALTDGQATSALLGLDELPADLPFSIFNIDTYVNPLSWLDAAISQDADGWVLCFPGLGTHWSFVKIDESGVATEFAEKVRISDHATVGLYYFKSPAIYRQAYQDTFLDFGNGSGLPERYVAPMYNSLIQRGMTVKVRSISYDAVIPLGTPAELNAFLQAHGSK